MFCWKAFFVCASLCCQVSLSQNEQENGSRQNTLVSIRILYNDRDDASESRIPAGYLSSCRIAGERVQPGETITVQADSLPACVTAAYQRYVKDLRSALKDVVERLESTEEQVSSATNNNVGLSIAPVINLVEGTLRAINEGNGLLDLTATVNALQPVVETVGETLSNLQGVLTTTTSAVGDMTSGLTSLLGGTLGAVDGLLSGVGTLVGGLGGAVDTVGDAVVDIVNIITNPVNRAVGALGKGLTETQLTDLLQGRKR